MVTIMDEIRNSEDDDWIGITSAQDRRDLESICAYSQLQLKVIPPEHDIVAVTILMGASHLAPDTTLPLLVVRHFDPGDSRDPHRMFNDGPSEGSIDIKQTTVRCNADIFAMFSDFAIELKRRSYTAELVEPWPAFPDAPEN